MTMSVGRPISVHSLCGRLSQAGIEPVAGRPLDPHTNPLAGTITIY